MLAVGNEIYVAGNFTQANAGSSPITVNHVARFNTQTNTWSALGTTTVGVATQARSLLSIGNDLYVGGVFTTAGGVSANNVARFNIQTNTWSALGSGVNGSSDALALSGDTLFVGGNFTLSGSFSINRVARYIISANKWERLWSGAGLDSEVRTLFVSGSDVYVGGNFSQAGDVSASRVARFNTQTRTWNPLGSGVNGDVYSIAVSGNDVYVGGLFSQAGGNSANNVARFNTQSSTWHRLGTFASNGVLGEVRALAVLGRWVFVGGSFVQAAGSLTVNHIARFDTQSETWSAMGTGGGVGVGGVAGAAVNALAVSGSSVYAGGSFSRVNEGASSPLTTNNVARYDTLTNAWSALGTSPNVGVGGQVHALAISGDWLYAGGQFTTAGGNTANRIARFNLASPAWSSLGTGTNNGVNSTVFAIAASGDNVFVGGNFSSAGTVSPTYRLARFNTTSSTWSIVGVGSGNGVDAGSSPAVRALSLSGSGLFLGGNFTTVNFGAGLPSNYIGRYFGADATSAGTQTVTGNGTFTFATTGVSIAFSGVLGTGNCTVSRYELPAQNVSFTGTPPTFTSQYRFVISATGFAFTSAELRFNRTQIPNAGITNASTVRVYRRPTPGTGAFSILPNAFNPSFPDEVRATTTAFSEFILASDDNQLPVELTEFGFRKVDSGIELHWRTATELNNSGFEVERKSHGADWNTLGFVRGRGTTTEAQSYSFLDRTASGKVQYRLKQVDFDGQFEYSNVIEVDAGAPKQFALEQNYPNPFNPTTTISYQLPVASQVSLKVYDVLGREVMTLVNGKQEAGVYNLSLNGATLSSGIYFYRLQSGNFVSTKKMMLVK
jgi:N-acetylneuraminic acid mutarotase